MGILVYISTLIQGYVVNVSCNHGMMNTQDLDDFSAFLYYAQDGVTAITWACQSGHVHVVKELVQANVNVNQRNKVKCMLLVCCS